MNKKHLSVLLGFTIIGALATYQFLNMDSGYLWSIPLILLLTSWYLMWLIVKQPKTKGKTLNFKRGDVLFLYDKKSA